MSWPLAGLWSLQTPQQPVGSQEPRPHYGYTIEAAADEEQLHNKLTFYRLRPLVVCVCHFFPPVFPFAAEHLMKTGM